jgi:tRNA(adenine34) deaminase
MQASKDIEYMNEALRQAKKAFDIDEVPIGAIIVKDDEIIAKAFNRRNTDKSTLAHAEIIAIDEASKVVGDWRLDDCTMYITLEPCPMCAGAIVQARIPRVVIAAYNKKAGCAGSILNLLEEERFNHQVDITSEILEEESSKLLKDFFRRLRVKNK